MDLDAGLLKLLRDLFKSWAITVPVCYLVNRLFASPSRFADFAWRYVKKTRIIVGSKEQKGEYKARVSVKFSARWSMAVADKFVIKVYMTLVFIFQLLKVLKGLWSTAVISSGLI